MYLKGFCFVSFSENIIRVSGTSGERHLDQKIWSCKVFSYVRGSVRGSLSLALFGWMYLKPRCCVRRITHEPPLASADLKSLTTHLAELKLSNLQFNILHFFFLQMIETECFKELNVLGPNNTPTPDLLINHTPPNNDDRGCFPFRRKVTYFTKL